MKRKIIKITINTIALTILIFLISLVIQNDVYAEVAQPPVYSSSSADFYGGLTGRYPYLGEITEEQRLNMERLEKMPFGKMNPDIWMKITSQISCLAETKQIKNNKVEDDRMVEIAKPFGVTGEEYMAFYLQMLNGKLDMNNFSGFNAEILFEKMNQEFEYLKKNNCRPAGGGDNGGNLQASSTVLVVPMTDELWFEITARIRCLDRISLMFTKYEIGKIFTPFGVTPAEYQAYSGDMIKKMEALADKDGSQWTKSDWDFGTLYNKFKVRLENLKKNNCVLEDGQAISEDYNLPDSEPAGWDKTKCKLFSCNNCYKVTDTSSFWEKYRCKNLCAGCPIGTPPDKPVYSCSGFCSQNNCPESADKIDGNCEPQKVCTRCGFLKLFSCCKQQETVCCQTKPAEKCIGTCGLKNCANGEMPTGANDCPSGKEKYKCGFLKLFNCKRNVAGVCCK